MSGQSTTLGVECKPLQCRRWASCEACLHSRRACDLCCLNLGCEVKTTNLCVKRFLEAGWMSCNVQKTQAHEISIRPIRQRL